MATFVNQKKPQKTPVFFCEKCNFISSNKKDYNRHIGTKKHFSNQLGVFVNQKKPQKTPYQLSCECGKTYKDKSGLWRHRKKCTYEIKTDTTNDMMTNDIDAETINITENKDEFIKYLIKENNEFKKMMVEQNSVMMKVCENTANTITNNINSNNKTFNLNVFLKEHCKDAMNLMDFVNSLKIQLSDLETVGKLGYVEGISTIIVKNLRAMDIHKRPVHCSDSKREVMYVKEQNKWEKENAEKNNLRKAIKYIAHKNSKLLPAFKEKYPDCMYSDSKKSNQYNKLMVESMGGAGDDDSCKENKIIRNIAKEVLIYKNIDPEENK